MQAPDGPVDPGQRGGRPVVEGGRQRPAHDRPLLERRPADEGDAQPLGQEAGDADEEEDAEDRRVLRLGLRPDAVGRPEVAAADGPQDAGQEGDPGDVGRQRVGLVDLAVEELHARRELVVGLE